VSYSTCTVRTVNPPLVIGSFLRGVPRDAFPSIILCYRCRTVLYGVQYYKTEIFIHKPPLVVPGIGNIVLYAVTVLLRHSKSNYFSVCRPTVPGTYRQTVVSTGTYWAVQVCFEYPMPDFSVYYPIIRIRGVASFKS
jgi:hypothetical protein